MPAMIRETSIATRIAASLLDRIVTINKTKSNRRNRKQNESRLLQTGRKS